MRCSCSKRLIFSVGSPSLTVTNFSFGVMILRTGWLRLFSKRISRWVTIPTTWLPSTTGTPLILFSLVMRSNSPTLVSGDTLIVSTTVPASNFFTRRTCMACKSMSMFLCKIPIPPSWAMVIAICDSVTVSIAAETMGKFSSIPRVKRVFKSTILGKTSE